MYRYWRCDCRNCGAPLKVRVSASDIGRRAKLDCLKCGERTETVIGNEAPTSVGESDSEKVGEEMRELIEIIQTHPEVIAIQKRLRQKGYSIEGLVITLYKYASMTSKIGEGGQIDPNLFTEDDEKILKGFKIKL